MSPASHGFFAWGATSAAAEVTVGGVCHAGGGSRSPGRLTPRYSFAASPAEASPASPPGPSAPASMTPSAQTMRGGFEHSAQHVHCPVPLMSAAMQLG